MKVKVFGASFPPIIGFCNIRLLWKSDFWSKITMSGNCFLSIACRCCNSRTITISGAFCTYLPSTCCPLSANACNYLGKRRTCRHAVNERFDLMRKPECVSLQYKYFHHEQLFYEVNASAAVGPALIVMESHWSIETKRTGSINHFKVRMDKLFKTFSKLLNHQMCVLLKLSNRWNVCFKLVVMKVTGDTVSMALVWCA